MLCLMKRKSEVFDRFRYFEAIQRDDLEANSWSMPEYLSNSQKRFVLQKGIQVEQTVA